jgi:formylglycine-generating enzyme required for sulfatase activity
MSRRPPLPVRILALVAGWLAAALPAGEAPAGMVRIPGGELRLGVSATVSATLAAHRAIALGATLDGLRALPRLAGLADAGDPDAAIAATLAALPARRAAELAQAETTRRLAAEHPGDPYLASRIATLDAFVADLDHQAALLRRIQAQRAFLRSQPAWQADELGEAVVSVRPFLMDVHEVTVADYRRFAEATGRPMPWPYQAAQSGRADLRGHPRSLFPEQVHPSFADDRSPIAGISWADARAYAAWAGKRLPTETEWLWAARGGLADPAYPWGDAPWDGSQANLGSAGLVALAPTTPNHVRLDGVGIDDRHPVLAPVGSYPANGYGLFDMAGNVLEWCDGTPFFQPRLAEVLRGATAPLPAQARRRWGQNADAFQPLMGSAYTESPFEARTGRRYGAPAGHTHAERGLRCAADIPGEHP